MIGTEMPKLMVVDDDPMMHVIFSTALDDLYQLVMVENGQDAVMVAESEQPEVILLDVEMAGLNGYDTCRLLKQSAACASIPVIFVSGQRDIEDRLKGYEAGGADYVVKPFDPRELALKIGGLIRFATEQSSLQSMADSATAVAMTAMSSMGEMGGVIDAIRRFNGCDTAEALLEALLAGLSGFGLQGVVQLRQPRQTLTQKLLGEVSPLELSIIQQMAAMDRIVQFKSRLAVSYEHVSLLVNNLPVDDGSGRGDRLRDHLAMLAEAADVRLRGIIAASEADAIRQTARSARMSELMSESINRITNTLRQIDDAQRQSHITTGLAVNAMMAQVEKALLSIALTDEQESLIAGIVRNGVDEILNAQTMGINLQDDLSNIVTELKRISQSSF